MIAETREHSFLPRPEFVTPFDRLKHTLDLPRLVDAQREKRLVWEFQRRKAHPRRLEIPGRTVANVEVRLPGKNPALAQVLILAHHDHISSDEGGGNGIVDNWSGVCALLWLYDQFRDAPTCRGLTFISFAYEERSQLGSRHYVNQFGEQTHAVINVECLGPAPLAYWTDDDSLASVAENVAASKLQPKVMPVSSYGGYPSDGLRFQQAGHRVITVDGISNLEECPIHSPMDRFETIVPDDLNTSLTYLYGLVRTFAEPAICSWRNPATHSEWWGSTDFLASNKNHSTRNVDCVNILVDTQGHCFVSSRIC